MKKVLFATVLFISVFSLIFIAGAYAGEPVGHIYSTDILAVVNGNEVPSYNIGGRTLIIPEELNDVYVGFFAMYDESGQVLSVSGKNGIIQATHAERGKVGRILGDVYDTDVKVLLNGKPIRGYDIGGRIAICLEDIGDLTDSPNAAYGYSKFAAKCVWYPDERVITLDFAGARPNEQLLTSAVSQYLFYFGDNVITAVYDPMNDYRSSFGYTPMGDTYYLFGNTPEFASEDCIIRPLYMKIGDDISEVGICFVDDHGHTYTDFADFDSVVRKLVQYRLEHKPHYTYGETIDMLCGEYELIQSIETEDYVFLLIKRQGAGSNSYSNDIMYGVSVSKNGDFAVMHRETVYPQIKVEKTGENKVSLSVYPFASPHGAAVWMTSEIDLRFN